MSVRSAADEHITVCLVADEEVIDRFPELVRYLQVGLIDEPISFLLLAPEHPRVTSLQAGPTKLLQYRHYHRLIERFAFKGIVREVTSVLNDAQTDGPLLVHSLTVTAAPLAAQIAAAMDADLLVNISNKKPLNEPSIFHAVQQAAEIITPVKYFADSFRVTPLKDKTLDVVPYGAVAEDEPSAFRKSGRVTTIMTAGPLDSSLGYDTFLRAIQSVNQTNPEIAVFVVGKGPAEAELRKMTNSLGLTSKVTFPGRLDNVRAAIKAADIFCVPKAPPAFREEPILALASGVLLIADVDILCDGLQHRHNSRLFEPGNEIAIADQINWSLGNREESRRVASAGLALAKARHTVSGMVENYLRIYGKIVGPRKTYQINKKPSASSR